MDDEGFTRKQDHTYFFYVNFFFQNLNWHIRFFFFYIADGLPACHRALMQKHSVICEMDQKTNKIKIKNKQEQPTFGARVLNAVLL